MNKQAYEQSPDELIFEQDMTKETEPKNDINELKWWTNEGKKGAIPLQNGSRRSNWKRETKRFEN